jgi:hypothetical protein
MAVQTQIQMRRDTAANWTSTNPTLASGEWGFETDTGLTKIGNGSTAWTLLNYSSASKSYTPKSGSYFRTPANQTGGTSFTTNLLYFTPIEIGGAITVTRILINTGTLVTSGNIRLGIYGSDTNGLPGSLVLDAGTVTPTTVASYQITISQALNAGRYWLAGVQQSGSMTIQGFTNTSLFSQGFQIDSVTTSNNPGFPTLSSVTGALPSTATGYNLNAVTTTMGVALGII